MERGKGRRSIYFFLPSLLSLPFSASIIKGKQGGGDSKIFLNWESLRAFCIFDGRESTIRDSLIFRVPSAATLCRQRPSLSVLPLPLQFPLCVQERRRRVVVRRQLGTDGSPQKRKLLLSSPPLLRSFSSMAAEDDFQAVTASDRRRHNFLCSKQPYPPPSFVSRSFVLISPRGGKSFAWCGMGGGDCWGGGGGK